MAAQKLQLRMRQQMALAPQLQQAIKLLQLNRLELREHIHQALEANPVLERQEFAEDQWEAADPAAGEDQAEDYETAAESDYETGEDWELPEGYGISQGGAQADFGQRELADTSQGSLLDHLLWQINLTRFSPADAAIARAIVYALDDDGYLLDSLEDIRASLAPEWLVEKDEVQAVLHRIQRMEPVGVATSDPRECLLVQLDTLAMDTPGRDLARRLVASYLDLLLRGQKAQLQQQLNADSQQLEQAMELIQSMEPRPGARFHNRHNEYLVPDVYFRKNKDQWQVALSPDSEPRLKLNNYYLRLLKSSSGEDAKYLQSRLQEARWLISSLELRNRTLLLVSQAIVEQQEAFLEQGEKAMRPLILKDIAERTGLHESTVSRATSRKYALTPRGLFELKYFFSSHLRTMDGKTVSSMSVKAHIRELIATETPLKPYSDQSITELLREKGINVARRTVAKYRDALAIPSSAERRREAKRIQAFQ